MPVYVRKCWWVFTVSWWVKVTAAYCAFVSSVLPAEATHDVHTYIAGLPIGRVFGLFGGRGCLTTGRFSCPAWISQGNDNRRDRDDPYFSMKKSSTGE